MQINDIDRWVIARAMRGLDVPEVMMSPMAWMLIEQLRNKTLENSQLVHYQEVFGHDFIKQIFAIDPNSEPPDLIGLTESRMPALPEKAVLSNDVRMAAAGVGVWLDQYMEWVSRYATMTDPLFLEAGGLWLISLATARRAVLKLDFGLIYNSLYVLWVAGTTYWRKSTGLRAIERLVRNTSLEHLLLAGQSTPEMLLYRLAGNTPSNYEDLDIQQKALEDKGKIHAAQRGFITDEVSKLFAKKYMEGLPELLMEMYDNPPILEQEFKIQGKLVVRNPGLSLLFSTTPARLSSVFGDGEWEDGLLPRFALLTPTSRIVHRTPTKRAKQGYNPTTEILKGLSLLYNMLPVPELDGDGVFDGGGVAFQTMNCTDVEISDAALEMFNHYADALHHFTRPDGPLDGRMTGVYGRLPVQALKVAMSLVLMDHAMAGAKGDPVISAAHWARAQEITEKWRASSHRLLAELNRSADQKNEDHVLRYLSLKHKTPPSKFQIYRASNIHKRTDAFAAIDALQEAGKIMKIDLAGKTGYQLTENIS